MTLRTLAVTALATIALLGHSQEEKAKSCPYSGGFTLGVMSQMAVADFENYLTFGYFNDWFLIDFGANYEYLDFRTIGVTSSVGQFMGHLGLRNRLSENLFFIYGVTGLGEASKKAPSRQWGAGCFTGLDLQIVRHFLLSVKIYPFIFEHTFETNRKYEVFESGDFTCSYVF